MGLHEKNATYTFFIHKFPKKKTEPRWTQTKEIVQIEWDHLDYYWKQLISFICETVQSNGMLKIWTRFAQKAFVKEMNILRWNWKYMHAFFSSLALFLFSLALFSPRGPSIINYSRNSSLSMELIDRPMNSVIIQWFLLDSSISVPKIECNGSVKIRPKRIWTKRMKCAWNHRMKLPFGKNWELECNCNLWVCVCVFVTSNNE